MFTTLICIAILIGMAWLLFTVLHEDRISKRKRAVAELINPDLKAELIRKLQASNEFAIARLKKILTSITKVFGGKEPETDYDQMVKAQILLWLAFLGILLDTVVQWAINIRIGFFSSLTWLVISLGVALALTWFTELTAYALTADPDRPELAIRRCRLGAVATGIVSLGALALFLFGRTASAASVNDFVVSLISGSLWIIGEGLAICCGFIGAWSRHLSRSWRASKHYHRTEQQLQVYGEFKEWLEIQAAELDEKHPPASKTTPAPQFPARPDTEPVSVAPNQSETVVRFTPATTEKSEKGA